MAFDAVVVRPEGVWPSHDQLGQDSERGNTATQDHFIIRDGVEFAGSHIIIDLWGASHLDDLERMERAFHDVISTCGATLLHIHLHHFTPNDGISGVAVLAESHISVHTWPERGFAAFDVFMCGDARPELAADVLRAYFEPTKVDVQSLRRGTVQTDSQGSNR
ncbi:MAG: adenosylmethionine decarboxylase [Pseudomonadota bacterium]